MPACIPELRRGTGWRATRRRPKRSATRRGLQVVGTRDARLPAIPTSPPTAPRLTPKAARGSKAQELLAAVADVRARPRRPPPRARGPGPGGRCCRSGARDAEGRERAAAARGVRGGGDAVGAATAWYLLRERRRATRRTRTPTSSRSRARAGAAEAGLSGCDLRDDGPAPPFRRLAGLMRRRRSGNPLESAPVPGAPRTVSRRKESRESPPSLRTKSFCSTASPARARARGDARHHGASGAAARARCWTSWPADRPARHRRSPRRRRGDFGRRRRARWTPPR